MISHQSWYKSIKVSIAGERDRYDLAVLSLLVLQGPALKCGVFVHAADRGAAHRSYDLGGHFVFNPFETVLTLQIQILNQYLSACQHIMKVWMPIVPSVVPKQTPDIMAASIPRRGSCIGPADLRS